MAKESNLKNADIAEEMSKRTKIRIGLVGAGFAANEIVIIKSMEKLYVSLQTS
jgi:hypothetical protein